MFSSVQLRQHKLTAVILTKIKDETFNFIRKNKESITEKKVQKFILNKFRENNLINEIDKPIVAFRENTGKIHYFPKKKSFRLRENTLILLDIWARLNVKEAPYSDITWMAFHGGNIPDKVKTAYKSVIRARDLSLGYIKDNLKKGIIPSGKQIDSVARKYLDKRYKNKFSHSLGHSIGLISPHGKYPHLKQSHDFPLLKNLPYTIEPGLYFKNKFGIRSEINFYINNKNKLVITTPMQKDIVRI
jgi:Xaa-Pro aminopeptidase